METDAAGRRRLNRERMLGAAVELVDREGLPALSMRRLAAELGVEAMALYRYASGKDGLLEGLVEALFTEARDRLDDRLRRTGPLDWRAELHLIAEVMHEVCLAHPQVVPLLVTRMLVVPLSRRPMVVLQMHERVLTLLGGAGFDQRQTLVVYRTFSAWLLGYTLVELRRVVESPEEPEPAFRLGLHRMPAHELPTLRAITPALAVPGGLQGLAAGLDLLLDGVTGSAERPGGGAEDR